MQLLPGILAAAVLLLAPGWAVARAARVSPWRCVALAPALSAAVVGVAEVAAHAVGLLWDAWGVAVVALLMVLAVGVMRLLVGPRPGDASRPGVLSPTMAVSRGPRWLLTGAVLVAMAVPAIAVLTSLPAVTYPAQAFDAAFHLNAVAAIREGGNASMVGGLADLYGGAAVYYPTVWHGIVALVPGSVVVASNATVLAVLAVVWPLTLTGMLLSVVPEPAAPGESRTSVGAPRRHPAAARTVAVAVTVVLSTGLVAFPLLLMTSLTVWPYALSVLALPGVLVALDQLRRGRPMLGRWRAALIVLGLGAGGGAVLAHGTGLFNLAVVGVPFLVEALVALARRGRAHRIRLAVGTVAVVLVLCAGVWLMRGPLASVLGYQRPDGGLAGAVGTLGQALADLPMYGSVPGGTLPVGALAGLLVLAGAWRARHDRSMRPWLVMWALALILVVLVGGPQWAGRQLGSPWYLQKARIAPLVLLPALVLTARVVAGLVARPPRWAGGRRRVVAVALATVALAGMVVGRLPLERALVASVWDPSRIQYGTLLTQDEIVLVQRMGSQLPDDAVVVGAPSLGGTYLWSLAGVHVVYPMRAEPTAGTAAAQLVDAWSTLGGSGSQACDLLRELGADYYYVDTDLTASGAVDARAPLRWDAPLAEVPTTGLELVDSEGGAQLWHITACG